MKSPKTPQLTEEQIQIISKVLGQMARKYTFGYYSREDMEQEGWIIALEGMERYDPTKPLENFIRTHIRNRFLNLLRNKLRRREAPCVTCPLWEKSTDFCNKYAGIKEDCDKWMGWVKINDAKQNLMEPVHAGEWTNTIKHHTEEPSRELLDRILDQLPHQHRANLFRVLDGLALGPKAHSELREAVMAIIGGEISPSQ